MFAFQVLVLPLVSRAYYVVADAVIDINMYVQKKEKILQASSLQTAIKICAKEQSKVTTQKCMRPERKAF